MNALEQYMNEMYGQPEGSAEPPPTFEPRLTTFDQRLTIGQRAVLQRLGSNGGIETARCFDRRSLTAVIRRGYARYIREGSRFTRVVITFAGYAALENDQQISRGNHG